MTTLKSFYCFALLLLFSTQFAFAQYNSEVSVDGELLVKYKSGTKASAVRLMNAETGDAAVEEFPDLGWQRIKLRAGRSVNQMISFYKANAAVESVQPNFYYHLLNAPDDPRFSELYGLQKISAPAAWDLSTGSAATIVADIDTGIAYNHQDLAPNMWHNPGEIPDNGIDDDANGFIDDYYGYDFFYNDSNPIDDAGGHGTRTSGIIGAVGNNALGVVGVNWNVRLMAIKIYSPNGFDTTSAQLINAYNYVRMMKKRGVNIRATNNSYGGCGEACGYDQATKDAIDALGDTGVLQVFAAGNDGRDIDVESYYPAGYTTPSILTVAASDSNDNRPGFSNYGSSSIDLAAPGVGILSTYNSSNDAYGIGDGTSFAAPHVTGAAALLASYYPNLSAASLKATLMNSVDILPQWNGVVKTSGRLNVLNALQNPTICTFNLSGNSQTVAFGGGNFSFNISAPTNCDFSITSNVNWISVTSGSAGSGDGTVSFNVSANSGAGRSGVITVAGQVFSVSQSAAKTNKRIRILF